MDDVIVSHGFVMFHYYLILFDISRYYLMF